MFEILSPEEIAKVANVCWKTLSPSGQTSLELVATAQRDKTLRDVRDWLMEACPHRAHNAKYFKPKGVCPKCWQE